MTDGLQAGASADERLIVGLGNPGGRYRDTRHNLGFRVVAELGQRWHLDLLRAECNALVAEASGVVLAMPQTYMNRSGYAVRCLMERRSLEANNILVVFDDFNLDLGRLRLRASGGPGGHRGMESILENLRTEDVPRLRLGVAPADIVMSGEDLVDFVLSPFADDELVIVDDLVARAADACESWLHEDAETAMNRFNS